MTPPPVSAETRANYAVQQIGADTAYAAGARGSGVKVAVIDTGISVAHPEFQGRIDSASTNIVTGSKATLNDELGHGSHVAGIIAANVNGSGMRGIAPSASLLVIRAEEQPSPPGCSSGCFAHSDLASAINYAVAQGVDVINLSLSASGALGSSYRQALLNAAASGVLVVIAAGNTGNDPGTEAKLAADAAALDTILAVGSVNQSNNLAATSARPGETLKDHFLVAPGVSIYSTWKDGGYAFLSGTSMATPHVSGAAAVLKSYFPSLTMRQVGEILRLTATDLGAAGVDAVYGHGLVDLARALQPIGSQSIAMGDSIDGRRIEYEGTRLALGPAFGDALGSVAALRGGMVLDAFDRPYRADFSDSITRSSGHVDLERLLVDDVDRQHVSLAGLQPLLGLDGMLSLRSERDWMAESTAGGTSLRERPDRQELDRVFLSADGGAFGRLAFGTGLTPTTIGASAAGTGGDVFLDSQTLLAPADVIIGRGSGAMTTLDLGERTRLRLGMLTTDLGPDGTANDTGHDGHVIAVGVDRKVGDRLTVDLGYSYLDESSTLLGARGDGAFALGSGAQTHLTTARLDYRLTPSVGLFAQATLGYSRLDGTDGVLSDWSTVRSDAFAVGLVADSVLDEGDRLGLLIGQPLRVASASALLDMPTTRDLDGNVERHRDRVSVTPEGRETRLELAYQRPLDAQRSLGSWLLLQHEPGHNADADPALGIGMRYTSRF